jgi:hypothetical protein
MASSRHHQASGFGLGGGNTICGPKLSRSGFSPSGWRENRALEDEIFLTVSAQAVVKLFDLAIATKEETLVNEHIKSASQNVKDLATIRGECTTGLSPESRAILGKAARFKGSKGWFKSVGLMEEAAREIIGPGPDFQLDRRWRPLRLTFSASPAVW